jgi:hypothetical protein
MVCGDRVRTIGKLTVECHDGIPASVECQVPAEAQHAIADRLIIPNETHGPELGVEHTVIIGRLHIVDTRLQKCDQRRVFRWQLHLAALAENREAVPVSSQRL